MNVNRDDDLSADSVVKIVSWSDEAIRREILRNITDDYAADLLFHLLRVNPDQRMQSFDAVLDHPYFSETRAHAENDEALRDVKSERMVVEAMDKRSGFIVLRTTELHSLSDKALSQLLKTEKILLRDGRVFSSADSEIPMCITIVNQLLTPLSTTHFNGDTNTSTEERIKLQSALAQEWLSRLSSFGSKLSELVGRDEDALTLREHCSSVCEAFVRSLIAPGKPLFVYLLDE